ncbi:MAG: phage tail tape measure protein [Planctomycetota bacterium]
MGRGAQGLANQLSNTRSSVVVMDDLTGATTRAAVALDSGRGSAVQVAGALEDVDRTGGRAALGARRVDDAFEAQGRTASRLTRTLAGLALAFVPLTAGFQAVRAARGAFDDIAGQETRLVGIAKTTNLAGAELQGLSDEIEGLGFQLRAISTNELFEIGQAAGQLGVQGSENIALFSSTVGKLGTASNLAGEEAATTLARLLNVTGESVSTVGTLASVIVDLGNNFAATESEIAANAQRVAQASAIYGVTSGQAAALGAALKSVGVEAELGGTSIGKTFRTLDQAVRGSGDELERVAAIAGVSGQEFAETFSQSATRGLELFVRGLGRIKRESGDVAQAIDSIGLEGERLIQVLGPLANRSDLLTEALRRQAAETANATALDREFNAANQTLAASVTRLRNSLQAASVAAGDSGVKGSIQGVIDVSAEAIAILAGVQGAYQKSSDAGRTVAEVANAVGDAFLYVAGVGVARVVLSTAQGLAVYVQQARVAAVTTDLFTGATTRANVAMAATRAFAISNPFLLIATGVGILVSAISFLGSDLEDIADDVDKVSDSAKTLEERLERLGRIRVEVERAEGVGEVEQQIAGLQQRIVELRGVSADFREDFGKLDDREFIGKLRDLQDKLGRESFVVPSVVLDLEEAEKQLAELRDKQRRAARTIPGPAGGPLDLTIDTRGLDRDLSAAEQRVADLRQRLAGVSLEDVASQLQTEAVQAVEDGIRQARQELEGLEGELEGKRAEREGRLRPGEAFLRDLEQQRALIEATTDAEKRRLQVIQERDQVASKERLKGQELEEFNRLVEEQIRLTEEAIQADEERQRVRREGEEGRRRLEEFGPSLQAEIDALQLQADAFDRSKGGLEALTAQRLLDEVAQQAAIGASEDQRAEIDRQIESVQALIDKRRELAVELERRQARSRIDTEFERLTTERRVSDETAAVLERNREAELSLSQAREIATSLVRIEAEANAANLEGVDALTRSYEEQAVALARLDRGQEGRPSRPRGRDTELRVSGEFEAGVAREIAVLQTFGREREKQIELARLRGDLEREASRRIEEGLESEGEARRRINLTLERSAELVDQLQTQQQLSRIFEGVGDAGARAFAEIITQIDNSREATERLLQELERIALEEFVIAPLREGIASALTSASQGLQGLLGTGGRAAADAADQGAEAATAATLQGAATAMGAAATTMGAASTTMGAASTGLTASAATYSTGTGTFSFAVTAFAAAVQAFAAGQAAGGASDALGAGASAIGGASGYVVQRSSVIPFARGGVPSRSVGRARPGAIGFDSPDMAGHLLSNRRTPAVQPFATGGFSTGQFASPSILETAGTLGLGYSAYGLLLGNEQDEENAKTALPLSLIALLLGGSGTLPFAKGGVSTGASTPAARSAAPAARPRGRVIPFASGGFSDIFGAFDLEGLGDLFNLGSISLKGSGGFFDFFTQGLGSDIGTGFGLYDLLRRKDDGEDYSIPSQNRPTQDPFLARHELRFPVDDSPRPPAVRYATGGIPPNPGLARPNTIVASPHIFPMANGNIGLVGEGAKPEGIFPLDPGRGGERGVQAMVRSLDDEGRMTQRQQVLSVRRMANGDLGVVADLFAAGGVLDGGHRDHLMEASFQPDYLSGSTARFETPPAVQASEDRDGQRRGGGATTQAPPRERRREPVSVTVTQQINARDADSFRRSKAQIAADTARGIRRQF